MPTNPTHLRPYPMAVAIDHHHHHPHGFKPWKRRCRLRSFPHPDPSLLDLSNPPPPPSSSSSPSSSHRRRDFHRSLSTPCFSSTGGAASADQNLTQITRVEIINSHHEKGTHALVVEAAIALASGALPIPALSGLEGAYFLRNRSGECFAVVKPINVDNRLGTQHAVSHAGENGLREVAAYLLDHGGFSGVPPTALIKITHPTTTTTTSSTLTTCMTLQWKIASIQRFVPHEFDAGDLGPSRFSVSSVHRIGILDVRLMNIDRHAGNILVRKHGSNNNYCDEFISELVPIDHGLCLPELLDDPYFEWLHWPQAAVPFSEQEAEYISALDPFKDADILRTELPSLKESAIRILVLCTVFLKRAAAAGLCLADIGGMMTREFCGVEEGPSVLEALCKKAETAIFGRKEEDGTDDERRQFDEFEMECDDRMFGVPLMLRRKGDQVETQAAGEQLNIVLGPLREEEEGEEPKLGGGIVKSMSLSAADLDFESGWDSESKSITFKGMSKEEWRLFLERFEQILPEALDARKSMQVLKQRRGASL